MKIKILILLFLIFLGLPKASLAADDNNRELHFKTGYSYLLKFDDKITFFSLGNTDAIDIKLLPEKIDNKNEIVLKPAKNCDTNLLIWTDGSFYNFVISVNDKNSSFPLIQSFTDDEELDKPPVLPVNASRSSQRK